MNLNVLRKFVECRLFQWAILGFVLFYYVYGIIGTSLFGQRFSDWFGTLGTSVYSLFQVMTLESWSMGIARPVIAVFPYAWIYFVSYILITSFIVMNIVVGIVLNSINESVSEEKLHDSGTDGDDARALELELNKLKKQISAVETLLNKINLSVAVEGPRS